MLKLANLYVEKIQIKYQKIVIFNNKYKYYNYFPYWDYNINIAKDSWNCIEMVSVDNNDHIIGLLKAEINRGSDKVSSLGIINFLEINYIFSKDLRQFIHDLFIKFNFRKIEFSVIVGNPIEKTYDKYINKYGGNIVGITHKSIKLQDNKYYDIKYYEIFREEYIKNNKFKKEE